MEGEKKRGRRRKRKKEKKIGRQLFRREREDRVIERRTRREDTSH